MRMSFVIPWDVAHTRREEGHSHMGAYYRRGLRLAVTSWVKGTHFCHWLFWLIIICTLILSAATPFLVADHLFWAYRRSTVSSKLDGNTEYTLTSVSKWIICFTDRFEKLVGLHITASFLVHYDCMMLWCSFLGWPNTDWRVGAESCNEMVRTEIFSNLEDCVRVRLDILLSYCLLCVYLVLKASKSLLIPSYIMSNCACVLRVCIQSQVSNISSNSISFVKYGAFMASKCCNLCQLPTKIQWHAAGYTRSLARHLILYFHDIPQRDYCPPLYMWI